MTFVITILQMGKLRPRRIKYQAKWTSVTLLISEGSMGIVNGWKASTLLFLSFVNLRKSHCLILPIYKMRESTKVDCKSQFHESSSIRLRTQCPFFHFEVFWTFPHIMLHSYLCFTLEAMAPIQGRVLTLSPLY